MPHGLTAETLQRYHARCTNAVYYRPGQLLKLGKRFPTWTHFRAFTTFWSSLVLRGGRPPVRRHS